jgi:hypothetical protein
MGGPESGLFRFPRVGEKVLICQDDSDRYHLVGFVPTVAAPFYPQNAQRNEGIESGYNPSQRNPGNMDEFLADNGLALRYKREANKNQPGDQATKGAGAFSEIGFYNKKSKWPDSVEEAAERLPEDKFSRIDALNIQSAGDIESRAENYQLFKAKRIEFLSNAPEVSEETRAENCRDRYAAWVSDLSPLVDAPLDDPLLHRGDIHFRAGKRIIIKAMGEVRIQAGRTTLIVNDSGFSVVTRKINSAVPIPNDASFNMSSRDGITMFGEAVDIASARKFSLSDAWGAGVGSMVGMLDISGRQIGHRTYSRAQQNYALGMNGLTLARNITIGSMAKHPQANFAATWVSYGLDWIKFLIETGKSVYDINKTYKNYMDHATDLDHRRTDILQQYLQAAQQRAAAALARGDDRTRVGEIFDHEKALIDEEDEHPSVQFDTTTNVLGMASTLVGAEPIEALMAALDLVLAVTSAVYAVVEQSYSAAWRVDLAGALFKGETKDWTPQKKSDFRDQLNIIALSIDGGIIEAAMGLMSAVSAIGMGGPASIRLRQSGDIVIKAGAQKKLYAELGRNASVPTAIFGIKAMKAVQTGIVIAEVATEFTKLVFDIEGLEDMIPAYLETETL